MNLHIVLNISPLESILQDYFEAPLIPFLIAEFDFIVGFQMLICVAAKYYVPLRCLWGVQWYTLRNIGSYS